MKYILMEGDNIADVPADNPVIVQQDLFQAVPVGNTKTTGSGPLYRWAFTLKSTYKGDGVDDVPIVPEYLAKILADFCKEFYFQLELGAGGYEHFQGCFSLRVKHRLSEVKNLIGFKTIHLEPIINWKASIRYCAKEEGRVAGPWDHNSSWIKVILELNWWQSSIRDTLLEEPSDRTVYWIYDRIGNKGKSAFCKWAAVKMGACVLNNGSFSDLAFALPANPKIVIFDLPRTIEGRVNYSAIEAVKNGLIFSGKYESKVKMFNPPHLLVFSNFEPDYVAMSRDRWVVICLDD